MWLSCLKSFCESGKNNDKLLPSSAEAQTKLQLLAGMVIISFNPPTHPDKYERDIIELNLNKSKITFLRGDSCMMHHHMDLVHYKVDFENLAFQLYFFFGRGGEYHCH